MTAPWTRGEVLPVLLVGALALQDAAFNPVDIPVGVAVVLAVANVLPLLWRRRRPVLAPVAVGALVLLRAALDAIPAQTTSTLPLLVVALFATAVHSPRLRDAAAAGAFCAVATVAGIALGSDEPANPADFVVVSVLLGAAWLVGVLVRRRTALTGQLRERGRAAERARDEEAQAAVAEERVRIARELHDVLAHSVSIISVQAGAAERQAPKDPERARAAVAQVRRTAEEVQGDLVRLLDVLRHPGADTLAPQPGLPELEDLVAQAREAGLPVTLRLDRSLAPEVPEGVALAAFRIVQEGLTNVRRHAGDVPTDVRVTAQGAGLRVEVVNLPGVSGGRGSGLGLVGMDERVRVHGGDLRTGPDATGRWVVDAVLPLETT